MDIIERIEKGQLLLQVREFSGENFLGRIRPEKQQDHNELLQLAKLGKQTQWVSVTERLPAEDDTILVWVGTTCVRACVGKTPYGPAWYLVDNKCYLNWWNVTHWMPLPPAPKGAER